MSEEQKPLLFQFFDWLAELFMPKQPEQEGTPPDAEEASVQRVQNQDQYEPQTREETIAEDKSIPDKPTGGKTTPRMDRQ